MKTPTLILIDIQKAFDDEMYWGDNRNNPKFEENIPQLLTFFRERKWSIIHVVHDSIAPNSPLKRTLPGGEFKPEAQPLSHESVIVKSVNSAFIGTDLDLQLRRLNAQHLVIGGLTTDHCVSTTARMAANYGYDVTLIADACATFDKKGINGETIPAETVHQINLASLHGEFANVVSLEAWMK